MTHTPDLELWQRNLVLQINAVAKGHKPMTFTRHTDPAHGWLEVPKTTLADLELQETDFSGYSYHDDDQVFLEEDLDAGFFLARYLSKYGKQAEVIDQHVDEEHWIRSLPNLPTNQYCTSLIWMRREGPQSC